MSRKNIILIAVFSCIFLILGIIGIISTFINKDSTSDTSLQDQGVVIDPISGESIDTESNLHQDNYSSDTADRPIILGISKLTDYGLTFDQETKVYDILYAFSTAQTPKIKNISFYKDSYTQKLSDEQGIAHMYFKIHANETKSDYYIDIEYKGISDAKVYVYQSDNKTLLFSQ
jgi:hypothetical protein